MPRIPRIWPWIRLRRLRSFFTSSGDRSLVLWQQQQLFSSTVLPSQFQIPLRGIFTIYPPRVFVKRVFTKSLCRNGKRIHGKVFIDGSWVFVYTDTVFKWMSTETYRSGHNENDSKSFDPQGSVGSNPTVSAIMRRYELFIVRNVFGLTIKGLSQNDFLKSYEAVPFF